MRKTILAGLGLALSLAGVAAAQQPDRSAARRERAGDERGFRGRGGPDGFLLKGITLTETQRDQLAQLRKSQRDQMASRRDELGKQREAVRAARQKGDTAAVRQLVQQQRFAMEQTRQQHIAAVRNLLTPDQRVQFDKNITELQQRMAKRGEQGARAGRGPASERNFRGQRGQRGQQRGG